MEWPSPEIADVRCEISNILQAVYRLMSKVDSLERMVLYEHAKSHAAPLNALPTVPPDTTEHRPH
jgi:hypothetical protein